MNRKDTPKQRCFWCGDDPLYMNYHDTEWGVPLHDDQGLFEMLILEGFQAGLSWITVLRKRENFRRAFHNFDPQAVSEMPTSECDLLMQDAGIIRNRLKIQGAVKNAQAFLKTKQEFGSFDRYLWSFTNHKTLRSVQALTRANMPSTSKESEALSKDLKRRGFVFVGSTVMYAHMQATGMVDDHIEGCFKYVSRSL